MIVDEDFVREERYIVLKISDIRQALSLYDMELLSDLIHTVENYRESEGKIPLECVCIESDWPIYEQAWELVKVFAKDTSR